MSILFIEYPGCSTCRKAKKWLIDNGVDFEDRHILEQNPTEEELAQWQKLSVLPLKKFFNTSGQLYRRLGLKDKLPGMAEAEQIKLLASDGMLVKRPLIVDGTAVLVGFKEVEWSEQLLKK